MLRVLSAVTLIAMLGATGDAFAQAGCQPTITQPCKTPDKPASQALKRTDAAQSDSNEPKDHSPRVRLDKDTDFKFGTGGIGLGRKF